MGYSEAGRYPERSCALGGDLRVGASRFKRQVYYAVEDLREGNAIAKFFGVLLFVLIVLNALSVFGETQPGLPQLAYRTFVIFGLVSTIIFGIEYLARLWVADLVYPKLTPTRARVKYALSVMGIIDLLAFVPAAFAWFLPISSQMFNGLRIIRLVRLIKLSRYMKGLQSIGRVFEKRKPEIVAAFMVLGLLTVTASVLMYTVENPVQPDQFDSVFTGMYWAMTTITSTGYGDLVPITGLGRFIGFCTMVLSIAVVAIPAGIFSAGFLSEFQADDRKKRAAKLTEQEQDSEE